MAATRDGIAEVEALERVFRALAHPSRRHVLMVLRARGDRVSAGQIARRFSCSWPTTTRHLRVLEEAGLVRVHKQGRERFYQLEREHLQRVVGDWLEHFTGSQAASSS
ncbi:MAG: metalloregulator ArsR/SmtB family transcription factor [Proteobacteria bacterium]|nr:metalloregulator ArsR/SmtB family transcription factor [Pseudomonadota bacterium]MCZ6784960.1 metalloregulator ArsR/SmtB family transcription factor [Pseudomonadota bacterium]